MSKPIRIFGVWLLFSAVGLCATATAQRSDSTTKNAPKRRPFAKAGTPRRTERIRFFDVKHIKAELTIDTRKREVRGVVTHSLSPLHPYLTHVELDCGPRLKVKRVTAGDRAGSCKFAANDGKLSITLDKAYGPGDTIELAIEYSGFSRTRALFRHAPGALPREAALVLDPGRIRGNARLDPLLRLSQ